MPCNLHDRIHSRIVRFAALLPLLYGCVIPVDAIARDRTELPALLRGSSIGAIIAYSRFPFTLDELQPGILPMDISTPQVAVRAFIDHAFNERLALRVSLMRPFEWVTYTGQPYFDTVHSIQLSIAALTLAPAVPLSRRTSLYGELGPGLLTRDGFEVEEVAAVTDFEALTVVLGGGLRYELARHWNADLNLMFVPAVAGKQQPATFLAGLGLSFVTTRPATRKPGPGGLLEPPLGVPPTRSNRQASDDPAYEFPLNCLHFGFVDHHLFRWDVNHYFTLPNLPIFWNGDVKTKRGAIVMYERNIYHTRKRFSIDWGASISSWESDKESLTFGAFSLFPSLKIWLVRGRTWDLYFTYSLAGPTVLTRNRFDGIDTGKNVTFQDFMGLGTFLGADKHLNVSVRIFHYSNGNLFAQNPGIAVPAVIGLGYAW
jgi:hypothetical protein